MRKTTPPPVDPRPVGGPNSSDPAILIGANEDERRLLRGLLLMHHQPIALEASSLESVPDVASEARARILVFVAPPESDHWSEELRGTLEARPELNALVLLPLDEPTTRSSADRAGARAVLRRPFTSREFFDAVDGLAPRSPPAAPPTRRRAGPGTRRR
jgi:DNA-binding NarL/FixJ family response regulator